MIERPDFDHSMRALHRMIAFTRGEAERLCIGDALAHLERAEDAVLYLLQSAPNETEPFPAAEHVTSLAEH